VDQFDDDAGRHRDEELTFSGPATLHLSYTEPAEPDRSSNATIPEEVQDLGNSDFRVATCSMLPTSFNKRYHEADVELMSRIRCREASETISISLPSVLAYPRTVRSSPSRWHRIGRYREHRKLCKEAWAHEHPRGPERYRRHRMDRYASGEANDWRSPGSKAETYTVHLPTGARPMTARSQGIGWSHGYGIRMIAVGYRSGISVED